jgi:hypothetical protein
VKKTVESLRLLNESDSLLDSHGQSQSSFSPSNQPSSLRVPGGVLTSARGARPLGNEDEEEVPAELLYIRIEDLELHRNDLLEELETTKAKARTLLMKKELQERKLKQVIYKFESYLKSKSCEKCKCELQGCESCGQMTQEQINQLGQMTDQELLESIE